jgi:hypothetical protein
LLNQKGERFGEARGFATPVILDRSSGLERNVSWQHATILLDQVRPLLRQEQHLRAIGVMVDVAANEGAITTLAKARYPSLARPREVLRSEESKAPHGLVGVSEAFGGASHEALANALRDVVDLLERHRERQWTFIIEGLVSRLTEDDPGAIDGILALYGGMGSFNDLYICQQNGHTIDDREVQSVNQRLREVAGRIWRLSTELKAGRTEVKNTRA